ncbi:MULTISPECIES: fluoride efflux transporter CrcB [Kocuria]|uniref:fluoride efflux transporter CrcB n=1 Tax=Kocuria TaxID=57493 RepID=UPI000738E468|nr:fluoride efflux transporter CrcB [Kocuria palustris]KUG52389.1 chromosome condensation protein CrcB [Kocuria palustris]
MTPLLFLAIAAAGGVGAVCRFVLDGLLTSLSEADFPWPTVLINITGSLLLGLVTGFAVSGLLPEAWRLVLGTGFLGGYTTFSTASVDTVRLLQQQRWAAGMVHGLGTLVIAVGAAGFGLGLGLWLGPAA